MEANGSEVARSLLAALAVRRGHFLYESGHHGDVWLDLNTLFVDARQVQRWAAALAQGSAACRPQVVCGPLTGGAFLAQLVASELGAGFVFAEQLLAEDGSARYRLPQSLRAAVRGKRVLLVDDVVNAGSAWTATLDDVRECGCELVGFATLLTLGNAASQIAQRHRAPLFALASLERGMWAPEQCPLCRSGAQLTYDLIRR